MAHRQVTCTKKNQGRDITHLGNPDATWGPRSKALIIDDIESGDHSYYVSWPEKTTEVRVVNGPDGKYLRTDRDDTTRNNLEDLPSC